MKYVVYLLLAISVLTGSTAFANGVYIGPAFKVDTAACTSSNSLNYYYGQHGPLQYSNGATGHATFKCKMDLITGPGEISLNEFTTEDWWGTGSVCSHTVYLEGKKGMWTAQCFYLWNSGD